MKYSKLALFCFILLLTSCFLNLIYAQQTGDYRSSGSGNWTDAANWEVYNGTTWVAATNYPGEVAGTNVVSIEGGYTISLGSTIPFAIQGLIVGDGTGATDTFQVSNTAYLDTPYIDLQTGGFAIWTDNVTLTLPAGSVFMISGGTLDNGIPCSAAKRLVIGTGVYSTCNGGADASYSFEDLINGGGSIAVTPSSNEPICAGGDLNLFSNPSGAGSSSATYNWTGTGPGSYSFSSSLQDPVESGLAAGSYSYTVTITDSFGYSSSGSVEVEVLSSAGITAQPLDQQGVVNGSVVFEVTASSATSYQWQISTDGGSTYSDLVDNSKYSGSQTTQLQVDNLQVSENGSLFRVVVQTSSSTCPEVTSIPAQLTVTVNTVITNRRITYRVNN